MNDATGIVMLKGKMTFFERLFKVEILIKFVVIDGHFDAGHLASPPNVIADFDFVSEPGVRFDVLLVDVTHAIE